MENIKSIDSLTQVRESYTIYGKYVMDGRALPSVVDGLKNVERRLLTVLLSRPKFKIDKSSALEGDTLKLHPHGGAYGSLVKLANTNPSFIITQGNFGGRDFGASAHRYTSAGLSNFAYLNYEYANSADTREGELDGYTEPVSLPCLLPYGFIEGSEGLGSGISSVLPKLDVLDMIESFKSYLINGKITNLPRFDLDGEVRLLSSKEETDKILIEGRGSFRYEGVIEKVNDKSVVLKYRPDRVKLDNIIKKTSDNEIDFINMGDHYIFELTKKSKIKIDELISLITKLTRTTKSINISLYKDEVGYVTNYEYSVKKSIKYLKKCIVKYYTDIIKTTTSKLEVLKCIRVMSKDEYLMTHLHKLSTSELVDYMKNNYEYTPSYEEALNKSIKSFTKDLSTDIEKLELIIKESSSIIEDDNLNTFIISKYDNLKEYLKKEYSNKTIYQEVLNDK